MRPRLKAAENGYAYRARAYDGRSSMRPRLKAAENRLAEAAAAAMVGFFNEAAA